MLSITQFKKNIYPLFAIMRKTGHVFEIVYKGVVYDVHVQATKKNPVRTRAKKARLETATVQRLETLPCPECDSIQVNGVCMNRECPTNS